MKNIFVLFIPLSIAILGASCSVGSPDETKKKLNMVWQIDAKTIPGGESLDMDNEIGPVLFNNRLFTTIGHGLFEIDPKTGDIIWSVFAPYNEELESKRTFGSTPLFYNGKILVRTSPPASLAEIDMTTGELLKIHDYLKPIDGFNGFSGHSKIMAINNSKLYMATKSSYEEPSPDPDFPYRVYVFEINLETFELERYFEIRNPQGYPRISSAALHVYNNNLLVPYLQVSSMDYQGGITAFDLETGEEKWNTQYLSGYNDASEGDDPILVDGILYTATWGGSGVWNRCGDRRDCDAESGLVLLQIFHKHRTHGV
jgi:outer membrane protein assembly factor BamB